MSSSRTDSQLRVLLDALDQAEARGQPAEARRLLAQARSVAPNHEAVLNAMAVAALRANNPAAAKELLERALTRNAAAPGIWVNLATACRELSDPAGESAALDRALTINPRDYFVLLKKAALLERQGLEFEATGMYQAALASAPPAAQVPTEVLPSLNRALAAVRAQAARMEQHLEAALAPVRAAHSGQNQWRIDYAIAAMLGRTRIYPSQSTFLQIPGFPAVPFYARDQFPWLSLLETATEAVASEASAVFAQSNSGAVPFVDFGGDIPVAEWSALHRSPNWSAFYLWKDGLPIDENLLRCPQAAALLDKLPLFDLPGNAPNVYFSSLAAGTRIPPHNGVSNARAITHLPLVVPERCYLRVGAEAREPKRGEACVFDDSIEHEAGNDGAGQRLVLILDVWNPYLTETERALLRATFRASADFARRPSLFAGRL